MALNHWPAIAAAVVASLVQTPPVPKPFPQPGQPPATATTPPARPDAQPTPQVPAQPAAMQAAAPTAAGTPSAATLGVQLYPTAEYIESFDAGKGQRYYLFGSNAAYVEVVGYYKNILRTGGRTVFEAPAMQQFELGKFQEQTMAFPPSVTVKDYAWNASEGYLVVDGTKEKRFKTIIQIVPNSVAVK